MLHHLESSQEPPVPRSGFELPSLVLDVTLYHLKSSGKSWLSPDSSHYTPGILQDRHTTWNKSPEKSKATPLSLFPFQ